MQKYLATICLAISAAVLFNSLHAKEFASVMPLYADNTYKKALQTDSDPNKLNLDLHYHVDKAGKVFSDSPQADARSLRLRDDKRAIRQNPLFGLLSAWRDRLALYLG